MPRHKSDARGEVGHSGPSWTPEVGRRFGEVLDLYATRVEAGKIAGKSDDQLRNYIAAASEPPMSTVARVAREKNVSLDWIISGQGTMFVIEAKGSRHIESSDIAAGLADSRARYTHGHSMVEIPELDVRASMGEGGFTLEVMRQNVAEHTRGTYGFPREGFIQLFGSEPENLYIIEAVGDSNVPEIWPGQRVIVDVSDRTPSPPGYFALWDGLAVVLKRVEYMMNSDPPTITLISANPAYPPRTITLGEAHILGRVKGNWVRR